MNVDTIRVRDIERYSTMENSIVIDLRSKGEYDLSHIPDAINVPYEDIDNYMDILDGFDNVILYCDRGNLSLLAARELSKRCRGRMISVGGGYIAYKQYHRMNSTPRHM